MHAKSRNSDGTLRRSNQPKQLTQRTLIARWVEGETLRLKQLGLAYEAIASHIVAVAQGQQRALADFPPSMEFPPAYRISTQAVHQAFQRAIMRLPNVEAEACRRLDNERYESMLLALQTGIRKGDPRSIDAAVNVLAHKARLNNYVLSAKLERSGKSGGPIQIDAVQWRNAMLRLMGEIE
jgi:hypothetical protein